MKNIAIITGASSGIGKEFVKILDNENFDEIWGIALEEEKLKLLKNEIKSKIKVFALDLTDAESFEKIKEKLTKEKPNVKWLVNCSGFGKFGRVDEIELKYSESMIDLNCKALVKMTEIVLPYMKENSNIVQIASIAAMQPVPYLTTYAATKAFVLSYSRGLRMELKSKKINVTCVCPFWTKTNFFNVAKQTKATNEVVTKYVVMYDATKVVKKAIKDTKKKKQVSIYGFKSKLQSFFVKLMPVSLIMNMWINQQKFKKKYKNK